MKESTNVTRFGVSIQDKLLVRFDEMIEKRGYTNRSEAIRDLIRDAIVDEDLSNQDDEAVGSVTLVYDHHTRALSEKLTGHQHSHHNEIISALHVHLDNHHCLEIVVVKGKIKKIKKMADGLIGTKGVKHGKLMLTTSGKNLS